MVSIGAYFACLVWMASKEKWSLQNVNLRKMIVMRRKGECLQGGERISKYWRARQVHLHA